MLQYLHVKNLALIEETEVEFGAGLNILTGETGAGKSLVIGSLNLALGGKFDKDMLRQGADSALVELIFTDDTPKVREQLLKMELEPQEDGTIIISRKLQEGKSTCRINGETVTARQVKELAELLIDMHGQHEHQSLLHKKNHMEILDGSCGEEFTAAAKEVERLYSLCAEIRKELKNETMDEDAKQKEKDLAEYEWQEIQQAKLVPGEDEELEQRYRLKVNGKRILEGLTESYRYTGGDDQDSAGGAVSRALRTLRNVSMYDKRLEELEGQLATVENLLSDYNRDLSGYMEQCEFDGEDFVRVEERLNLINHLKSKYGDSIQKILEYGEERHQLLQKFENYDYYTEERQRKLAEAEKQLQAACEQLSKIRIKNAKVLSEQLKETLQLLNFMTVEFEIAVRPQQTVTPQGFDEVEFLISTNPGESMKPLSQVASGGELSRVMLAIKTVLASRDAIGTMVFDEIDAGISGRTAWRVSEQMDVVAANTQVICITHLPQIAAMADKHFVIEKSSTENNTITEIRCLDEDGCLMELARLLGGDALTAAAMTNARAMRSLAMTHKKKQETQE